MSGRTPEHDILVGIRMLLMDVDGVLTDGRIHFDYTGNEVKSFHVHDAAGIVYWHRAGGLTGFLSGRSGRIVEERGRELGVHEIHLGAVDKNSVFDEILTRRDLAPEQVAYVGDDLLDLPVLRRVGLAVAPPSGRPEVLESVHLVTATDAGCGVVRETVEYLLRAQGRWEDVVTRSGLP